MATPAGGPVATAGVPWGEAGRQVAENTPVSLRSRVRLAAHPDDTEPAVEVGATLLLLYEMQNDGASPISIWHAGFWPNHRILVSNAKGEAAPLTPFGKTAMESFDPRGVRDKNVEWPLEAGAIDASEGAYDLNKLYELPVPGRYTVRVDYEEEMLVRSNTLPFWLLPVGAAEPAHGQGTDAEGTKAMSGETKTMRVRFAARVESVRTLSEYSGTAKPVHADPRFALILHVEKATPSGSGIAANAREVFLIHSVAKLFRGGGVESSVGGEFEFSVQRTKSAQGIRWSDLRVEPAGSR